MQANSNPHRTDLKRGSKKRVAPGVYERAGKYSVSYIGPDGREHLKTVGWVKSDANPDGFTLTQAKAERERLRVHVRAGEAVAPTKTTFGEVADEFLAHFETRVAAGERSERTLDAYRYLYRVHVEPVLGSVAIQQLQAKQLKRFLGGLRTKRRNGKPLSPSTVAGALKLVSLICKDAVTEG
jgi:hypothetical protein